MSGASSSSTNKRRLARFTYEPAKVVEVIGRGRRAYLWVGVDDEGGRADYFGSIESRRVIQLLKRAGLIKPEDVS